MNSGKTNPLANIPGVDTILGADEAAPLVNKYGHAELVQCIRAQLSTIRAYLKSAPGSSIPTVADLLSEAEATLDSQNRGSLQQVLNLTGTVIHTNLGRSQLPQAAIDQINAVATAASNLEYDISTGKRGDRDSHTEQLLAELTGAEAATIVNNNAAAVLLVLNTLGKNLEVPVSRGELVEIGGSFRIPDIMSGSGCTLVEVGTTNRTHLADYQNAIGAETAMLMKVHTSNYEIQGFTKSVDEAALADLAHEHNIPFVTDLGSGTLLDFGPHGLPPEPTVQQAVLNGADIVTFSGDKLLGGPQAGIIVGTRELIKRIKSNPLKRALRVDKMTIAALFEVLKAYRNPETVITKLPTLRHLTRDQADIKQMAEFLTPMLQKAVEAFATAETVECKSQIGSGSLPTALIPSWGIRITPARSDSDTSHERLLQEIIVAFRQLPQPMIGRVQDSALIFDVRTLDDANAVTDQLTLLTL